MKQNDSNLETFFTFIFGAIAVVLYLAFQLTVFGLIIMAAIYMGKAFLNLF